MSWLVLSTLALLSVYGLLVVADLRRIFELDGSQRNFTSVGSLFRERLKHALLRKQLAEPLLAMLPSESRLPDVEWWYRELQKRKGAIDAVAFLEIALPIVQRGLCSRGVAGLLYPPVVSNRAATFTSLPAFGPRFERSVRSISDPFRLSGEAIELRDGADSFSFAGDLSVYGFRYSLLMVVRAGSASEATFVFWCGYDGNSRPTPEMITLARTMVGELELRYRMLQDLMVLSARVNEAEGLSQEKSEFIAHMSHDIRSPLNNIRSILNLLRLESNDIEQAELLDGALKNCESLTEIVDDILDFSRHRAGKLSARREKFDLRELVLEILDNFKPSVRFKGIGLDTVGLILPAYVNADRRQVKRIVSNIISNAVKYTEHGSITVSLEQTPDRYAALAVSDTGIGMNQEQLSNLFIPFVRFERGIEGIGLGLTVSKILVGLNKGILDVFSTKGKGSRFIVKLELSEQRSPGLPQLHAIDRQNVLVVDDDLDFLQSLERVLQSEGFRVLKAMSVTEALGLFNFDVPDVIISDLAVPGGGGRRLAEHVRRSGRPTRFCFLSGAQPPREAQHLADGIFLKPLDISEFLKWLHAVEGEASRVA